MLTLLGIIVVPLGIFWCFRLNATRLLYLFTAVTPLSAATIVEFNGSTFGMPPSFFIAILLIYVFLIRCFTHKSKILIGGAERYYYLSFFILWLYNLISLLFPAIFLLFRNSYYLFNPAFNDMNYASDIPSYTITQFVYFTFFLLTTFVIMNETTNLCVAKKILKIILGAALFSAIWGVVFYILNITGVVVYPYWIFNNHPGYLQGYDQKFGILSRMSSVAQEPSVYGYFLAIMISMVLALNVLDLYVLKPVGQKGLFFILILTAILTTSTTAYIGILTSIMITILLAALFGLLRKALSYLFKQLIFISLIFVGLLSVVFNKIDLDLDAIRESIYQLTILKSETGSGNERSESFFHGIKLLSDTFYLGSGFASNRNFDMGSTILANTGIIGLILFICSFGGAIAFSLFKTKMSVKLNSRLDDVNKIVISLVSALVTALVLMFISIPDFVNMYFWLILGLLMGMTRLISNNQPPAPISLISNKLCR